MAEPMIALSPSGASTSRCLPNLRLQAVAGAKDTARPADVLTEHHHPLVARHFERERIAHGFDDGHLRHQSPSSAARRWASRRAGISANTWRRLSATVDGANRLRFGPGGVERGGDVLFHVGADRLAPLAAAFQILLQAKERILRPPGVAHAGRLAPRPVVGGGVHAEAIGQALDERRAVAAPGAFDRLAHHVDDGEEIVAVDLHAGEAVGDRLLRNRRRRRLQLARRGNRPVIVLAEEDDRRLDDAGEIGGLVKVALRRGALAEVDDDHIVFALEAEAPAETDGVRDLAGDGGVERQHFHAGMDAEAERAAHVPEKRLDQRQAVMQLAGGFAILRHEPVARAVEWNDAADAARFLADAGSEREHQAAALEVDAALVEAAAEQHGPEPLERGVIVERRRGSDERAVGSELLDRRRQRVAIEREHAGRLKRVEHGG